MNAPTKWRQQIWITGRSLRRLMNGTNLKALDASKGIVICGAGNHFPELSGTDWAAGCCEWQESDTGLTDIREILDALISDSFLIEADGPQHEIEAFMRGAT